MIKYKKWIYLFFILITIVVTTADTYLNANVLYINTLFKLLYCIGTYLINTSKVNYWIYIITSSIIYELFIQ